MAVIGGRNVGNNDLVIMGAGVLMFIDSFLPWYGVSVKGFGGGTLSGWHFFWNWLSIILVIAIAGAVAARVFANRALPPVAGGNYSWNLIQAALGVLIVVILLIRWLTYPSAPAHSGVDAGARIGTYIGLIIAIVQTVFSYLNVVASGERLPWQQQRTA
jgi:hypothetical protein